MKALVDWVSGEGPLPRQPSFCCVLTEEGMSKLSGPTFIKAQIHMGALFSSSINNCLPKGPALNIDTNTLKIHWGIGFNIQIWGRTHSDHSSSV